jgi:hypothetical protein
MMKGSDVVRAGTGVVPIPCPDCGGTGSAGRAGQYQVWCGTCDGSGMTLMGYMAIRQW